MANVSSRFFSVVLRDKRTVSGVKTEYPKVDYERFRSCCRVYDASRHSDLDRIQFVSALRKLYKVKPKQVVECFCLDTDYFDAPSDYWCWCPYDVN